MSLLNIIQLKVYSVNPNLRPIKDRKGTHMSLLNPSWGTFPAGARHAASLRTTLRWVAENAFQTLEKMGQRRAAPVLLQVGQRLSAEHHPAGPGLIATARDWAKS
jgi:hypothetical protein